MSRSESQEMIRVIQQLSPLPSVRSLRPQQIFRYLLSDKKIIEQRLRFVLPVGIGAVEIASDVPRSAGRTTFFVPTSMLGPKAAEIRRMFTAIAYRYDFLNHLLSLNIDRIWRRKAVQMLKEPLGQSKALCLDLCCGTGDLSFAMRARGVARVVGSDFSHTMLQRNQEKIRQCGLESSHFHRGSRCLVASIQVR